MLAAAVAASTFVVGPARAAIETVADTFASYGYSGSTGSQPWAGSWTDSEDGDPDDGAAMIEDAPRCAADPCLIIGKEGADTVTVARAVDLSAATSADLSFDYEIHTHGSGAGSVQLRISDDGGGAWSVLRVYDLDSSVGPSTESVDILAFATNLSIIDFRLVGGTDDSHINVDNVVITFDQNSPPSIAPIVPITRDEQSTIAFTATATDPDLDTITYSLSGEPTGATIGPLSGDFAWTPTEAQGPGVYSFDVIASDPFGLSDTTQATITVSEVNRAPSLSAIGDQSDLEGGTVLLATSATDPDLPTNTLTFSAAGLPPGLTINPGSGAITGTIDFGAAAASPYTVTIRVADDGAPSLNDEVAFTWTTPNTNLPPKLDPIGDKDLVEGSTLGFTASASDPDLDGLVFSLSGSVPAGASIHPVSGAFSWTPTEAQDGTHTFDVVVADDGSPTGSDSETITVTVIEINSAPVLAALTDRADQEGDTVSVSPTATDTDVPVDTLLWSASGLPAGLAIHPGTGVISGTISDGAAGSYTVRVTVDDGRDGSDDESFAWLVTIESSGPTPPPNKPPKLDVGSDVAVLPGDTVSFSVTATDADGDDTSISLGAGAPTGAIVSPVGEFSWATSVETPPGEYEVTFIATDEHGAKASGVVRITVMTALDQAHELAVDEDGSVPVPLATVDESGQELSYLLIEPPLLGQMYGEDGQWIYEPNPDVSGLDSARFEVTTPDGNVGTAVVTLTIRPVNDSPVAGQDAYSITWLESIEVDAPGVLVNDDDADGDSLEASVMQAPDSGELTLSLDGGFTYSPAIGHTGDVTFTYRATDPSGASAVGTVSIRVERPTTLSASDRETVVSAIIDLGSRNGDQVLAPDGEPVRRTLVVMARSSALAVQQMGFPLLLLLAGGFAVVTIGRLRLVPMFRRRRPGYGFVRSYSADRGYGLIVSDEGDEELFLHGSMLRRRDRRVLAVGDRVRYRSTQGAQRDIITRAQKT